MSSPASNTGVSVEAVGFTEKWARWQQQRLDSATAPHGPAALILTHWVTPGPAHAIADVAGQWSATARGIRGTGLEAAGLTVVTDDADTSVGDSVELASGGVTALRDGDRLLRLFERDGVFALRVFDPAARGRTGIERIDAFEPNERWRVAARFEPRSEPREIKLADGYQRTVETSGSLVFDLEHAEYRLTATRNAAGFSIVFGDATSGAETYGFRFLSAPLPKDNGEVDLDFNRAYLPPCAFSNQFVCPLPTPENRLPVAILAGEKQVVRAA